MTGPVRPVVAVVGLGAMGRRLAANLLVDGFPVVVSNRTAASADALVAAGATVAGSPRAAASAAAVTLVAVRDDEASREVWTDPARGLLAGLSPSAVGVECSTVSPTWVRELARLAGTADARLLEAPMIGSRPQVEARGLVHLAAGPVAALDRAREVLAVSAARVHHCGGFGTAAVLKLVVNALLATQVATVAELLGVTERAGIPAATTTALLESLPVTSPAAARAAGAMARHSFAPNFPVELVAKDLRYLRDLAAQLGGRTPVTDRVMAGFVQLADRGHGSDDLTAIARTHLPA